MGFLKKMMAAIGVGNASVDAQVHHNAVRVGGQVTGVVVIRGGAIEQRIERINLGLATRYKTDDSYMTHQLSKEQVVPGFTLRPGEVREFPFSIAVPLNTPSVCPARRCGWPPTPTLRARSTPAIRITCKSCPVPRRKP
nr:sporulation protein [Deinococcus cavernae]